MISLGDDISPYERSIEGEVSSQQERSLNEVASVSSGDAVKRTLTTDLFEHDAQFPDSNKPLMSDCEMAAKKRRLEEREDSKMPNSEFLTFKDALLQQLNHTLPAGQARLPKFVRDTSHEVQRILNQSVVQKESHSAILVGPRGSLKTAVINHHIALLSQKFDKQFVVIRLNGFVHSELAAINSIALQLESQLQGLHGKEETELQISSGSLAEVFEKILRLVDSSWREKTTALSRNDKISIIFIFDEIDAFAGPMRQTLLYNLFDMVEQAQVPVCILGCTTKLTVVENLEKRVKSRFSQRIIFVPQITTLPEFIDNFRDEILLQEKHSATAATWNQAVQALLSTETSRLCSMLRSNFETFRSLPLLTTAVFFAFSREKSLEGLIKAITSCTTIEAYFENQYANSLVAKVESLSDLEVALLTAAARAALKHEDSVNFNLSYAEYASMIKETNKKIPSVTQADGDGFKLDNTLRVWSKRDVKNVWENLIDMGLLTEKGAVGLRASAQAAFQASNYQNTGTSIPFDLRIFQLQITLFEIRKTLPQSSMFYNWTQL
ncbi:LAMI_0G16116g1_1 [Lachancea mirantina]|uniref:Origin recognition complex subunit 4 n=1 Tax=Lachancea mirantina TaxID=1230905 RepID=A0A1G4KCI2_9SACH|nr:LAMI_0G16116g1_1 [Lachancea mirantina]